MPQMSPMSWWKLSIFTALLMNTIQMLQPMVGKIKPKNKMEKMNMIKWAW